MFNMLSECASECASQAPLYSQYCRFLLWYHKLIFILLMQIIFPSRLWFISFVVLRFVRPAVSFWLYNWSFAFSSLWLVRLNNRKHLIPAIIILTQSRFSIYLNKVIMDEKNHLNKLALEPSLLQIPLTGQRMITLIIKVPIFLCF